MALNMMGAAIPGLAGVKAGLAAGGARRAMTISALQKINAKSPLTAGQIASLGLNPSLFQAAPNPTVVGGPSGPAPTGGPPGPKHPYQVGSATKLQPGETITGHSAEGLTTSNGRVIPINAMTPAERAAHTYRPVGFGSDVSSGGGYGPAPAYTPPSKTTMTNDARPPGPPTGTSTTKDEKPPGTTTAPTTKPTTKTTITTAPPTAYQPTAYQPDNSDWNTFMKLLISQMGYQPTDYSMAAGSAADKQIASQVAMYKAIQQGLVNQGVNMGEAIQAAGNAVANMQKNLGGSVATAYNRAGQDIAGIANAFTNQYSQNAAAENAQTQVLANRIGGGDLHPIVNTPAAAMAMGTEYGALPGQNLIEAGANLKAALTPGQLGPGVQGQYIGAARQNALLAMGAANQAANAYNAQIAQTYGQRPNLVNQYLSSFSQIGQNAIDNRMKALGLMASAIQAAQGNRYKYDALGQAGQIAAGSQAISAGNLTERQVHDRNTEINTANANTIRRIHNHVMEGIAAARSSNDAGKNQKVATSISNDIALALNGKSTFKETAGTGGQPSTWNQVVTVAPRSITDAYQWLVGRYPGTAPRFIWQQLRIAYGVPPSMTDSQVISGGVSPLDPNFSIWPLNPTPNYNPQPIGIYPIGGPPPGG